MTSILEAPNGTLWTVEREAADVVTLRRFAGRRTMTISRHELDVAAWRET